MQELSILGNILIFTFVGSLGGLIGGVILLAKERFALRISHFLASFAAGVLLGTAFFDLLPEALVDAEKLGINVFFWTLIGIIFFFFTERFIHWFHHHEEYHSEKRSSQNTVPLIIFGDTVHNFIDGVVIAATFFISIPLGIITSLAVFAHELPQEIGDFGLLLHKGLNRKKIIFVNILSALASFAGAILTYLAGNALINYIPIFISITAGFFIYIAASDLIPEIHHEKRKGYAAIESIMLLIGVLIVWASVTFLVE
ncbi:MAG: ZIP family metal transporter [Candidatus Levybacteria bacterium]|nr:ZIP family metal transporter [Candidatus Levybacteria bacterium]